jgi:hypothetical protein
MCRTPDTTTILRPEDFRIMDRAMRAAAPKPGRIVIDDGHREAVGKAVIRLYTAGVTDPGAARRCRSGHGGDKAARAPPLTCPVRLPPHPVRSQA